MRLYCLANTGQNLSAESVKPTGFTVIGASGIGTAEPTDSNQITQSAPSEMAVRPASQLGRERRSSPGWGKGGAKEGEKLVLLPPRPRVHVRGEPVRRVARGHEEDL